MSDGVLQASAVGVWSLMAILCYRSVRVVVLIVVKSRFCAEGHWAILPFCDMMGICGRSVSLGDRFRRLTNCICLRYCLRSRELEHRSISADRLSERASQEHRRKYVLRKNIKLGTECVNTVSINNILCHEIDRLGSIVSKIKRVA